MSILYHPLTYQSITINIINNLSFSTSSLIDIYILYLLNYLVDD